MNSVLSKLGAVTSAAGRVAKVARDSGVPAMKWARRAGTFLGMVAPVPSPARYIASFAAGTAVGLVAGLAVAPASGAMTRRRIFTMITKASEANPTAKRFADAVFGAVKIDRDPDGPGDAAAAGETREAAPEPRHEEAAHERSHKKRNGHTRATA